MAPLISRLRSCRLPARSSIAASAPLLARAGTREFWQIDPALRQIQRFVFAENQDKPLALIDEPETFSTPLFPGLVIATTEIFRR